MLYLAERPRELVPAALTSLGRALQLDPGSAQSHVVRGVFSAFYEYNWNAADEHFVKALEMGPASAMVRVGRALWFLLPTMQLAEALEEIKAAVSLDPFSPAVRTTELWILYTMKNLNAADRARGLVQMFPSLPICRFAAGLTLLRHGLIGEAVLCLEEGLKVVPGDVFLLGVLALARAGQGRASDAGQIRAGLEGRARTRYIPLLSRAYATEACGDVEGVLWVTGPSHRRARTPRSDLARGSPRRPAGSSFSVAVAQNESGVFGYRKARRLTCQLVSATLARRTKISLIGHRKFTTPCRQCPIIPFSGSKCDAAWLTAWPLARSAWEGAMPQKPTTSQDPNVAGDRNSAFAVPPIIEAGCKIGSVANRATFSLDTSGRINII